MKTALNHVAFLVKSIESALERNSFSSGDLGEIEDFASEGTREIYVGRSVMGRVLLMQAIGDGPYQRALEKRGEGLHHIALDVENIDEFINQISGSGWYLHPRSLDLYNKSKQVYLCRPGIPVLIEIQERKIFAEDDYFIQKVGFPFKSEALLNALGCDRILENKQIKILGKEDTELYRT